MVSVFARRPVLIVPFFLSRSRRGRRRRAPSELSDIPCGPCLGFYVRDGSAKKKKKKKEVVVVEEAAAAAAATSKKNKKKKKKTAAAASRKPTSVALKKNQRKRAAMESDDDDTEDEDEEEEEEEATSPARVGATAGNPDNFFWQGQRIFDPRTGKCNLEMARSAVSSASPISQQAALGTKSVRGTKTKRAKIAPPFLVAARAAERKKERKLVPERRLKNITEREEGIAVQYLVLGGHRHYILDDSDKSLVPTPFRVASALHAGPGQMSFGWDHRQRADLFLAYERARGSGSPGFTPTLLCFHNHHEMGVHYSGHQEDCSRIQAAENGERSRRGEGGHQETVLSRRCDLYRRGLAEALTAVAPHRVIFRYTTTTSCDLMHGTDSRRCVPSTLANDAGETSVFFATALEACLLEREKAFLYVSPTERDRAIDVGRELLPGIENGSITGFLTIKGGRESERAAAESPAAARFGFCVQKYAPKPHKVSGFTRRQVADLLGHAGDAETEDYLKKQAPRTLNSGTFHSWETVTTSYLRWLIKERGFHDFRIRHLLLYRFSDEPKNFLEPVLQKRHDSKRMGNVVAAECLKLIGNGSFGYNALEAANYSSVRLMTGEALRKKRHRDMAELTLKHVTLLGLVRIKRKPRKKKNNSKKKKKKRQRKRESAGGAFFLDDSARDVDSEEEDEEDDDDDDAEDDDIEEITDNDGDDDDDDDSDNFDEAAETRAVLGIAKDAEEPEEAEDPEAEPFGEDDRAVERQDRSRFKDSEFTCEPLYAVEIDGKKRRIFNNLPKAVAVLGNSKRLFFSHLNVMLRCLDPALSELCYVDTDSCLWSLTFQNIEDCLLEERKKEWRNRDIIADETSAVSCHGKMKLEGTYRAGLFKTTKIYRLFDEETYTRCKGVNRHVAHRLEDRHFDSSWNNAVVVHRTCLKPTRTGEIVVATETRSLSVPFNFKRFVTPDGIHTLPFSALESHHNPDDSDSNSSTTTDDDDDDDDDVSTANDSDAYIQEF